MLPKLQQEESKVDARDIHEIDTRPFQVFDSVARIEANSNKFSSARPLVASGAHQVASDQIPEAHIQEEEFQRDTEIDDNASTLSRELQLAKVQK